MSRTAATTSLQRCAPTTASCRSSPNGIHSTAGACLCYPAARPHSTLRPALISRGARISDTRCRHFDHSDNILLDGPEKARYECAPEAGVWNVHHLAETHHLSIVPFWFASASQKAFWLDLGHWLRTIDRTPRGG